MECKFIPAFFFLTNEAYAVYGLVGLVLITLCYTMYNMLKKLQLYLYGYIRKNGYLYVFRSFRSVPGQAKQSKLVELFFLPSLNVDICFAYTVVFKYHMRLVVVLFIQFDSFYFRAFAKTFILLFSLILTLILNRLYTIPAD